MADLPAISLHSEGREGHPGHIVVCVEVDGTWVEIIRTMVADVGGVISQIVEPGGIEACRRNPKLCRPWPLPEEPHPHG